MNHSQAKVHEFPSILCSLQDEVAELRSQRANLVSDIARLNDDLLRVTQKIEDGRRNHTREQEDTQREIGSLQNQERRLRTECNALKQTIESHEPRRRHLEADIADRQGQIERQQKESTELLKNIGEYEHQLADAKELWINVVKQLEDDTRKLETTRTQTEQLENRRVEAQLLEEKIQKAKIEHFRVTEELRHIEADAEESRNRLATLESTIETKRRDELDLVRLRNELELANTKLQLERENLDDRIGDLRGEYHSLSTQVDQILEKKITAERDVQQTLFRLKSYQASVEPLRESIEQKNQEQERLLREIESSRRVLRELTDQTLDREKRLDLLSARMTEIQGIIHRNESTIETLRREEEVVRNQIEKRKAALAHADGELLDVRRQTELLEATKADLELDLRAQREVMNRLADDILRTQKELAHLDGRRQELDKQCHDLDSDRENLAAGKQRLTHEIDKLQSDMNSLERSIEDATARLASAQTQRQTLQESSADLERAIARAHNELEKTQNESREATNHLDSLRDRIQIVEADIDRLRGDEEHERERQQKMETRTHEVAAELATREARLTELQDQERFVKAALQATQQRKEELLETIAQLEGQESTLLTRIDSIRQDLSHTDETRKQADERIEILQKKIKKLDDLLESGMSKREALASTLRREGESIRQARERLKELESLKSSRIAEINELRKTAREVTVAESAPEGQTNDETARIRADAERTLSSLRRRLQDSSPKKTGE